MTVRSRQRPGQDWMVGQAGHRIWIADGWRVLDVGSGHQPHPRADVLLERHLDDHSERSGARVIPDARLVVGDGQAMPFKDGEFDYAIASHIAEHVEDPASLCRELARVAGRGYVETPGWLGDILLRESFHRWRVRRTRTGLRFDRVVEAHPWSLLAGFVYGIAYLGLARPGHRTWVATGPIEGALASLIRRVVARVLLAPGIRGLFYMELEWVGGIVVEVR